MNFGRRYPLNVAGKFYIDDQCTDCDLCRESAPRNIRRDDRYGHSYVFKQPESADEVAAVMEGVQGCSTEAVRDDGDRHDWNREPMIDWNQKLNGLGYEANFEFTVPVTPYQQALEEERIAMDQWKSEKKIPWWKWFFR